MEVCKLLLHLRKFNISDRHPLAHHNKEQRMYIYFEEMRSLENIFAFARLLSIFCLREEMKVSESRLKVIS
ncbi:hypothetical protein DPMN_015074 [Dreissena polymorpha]|uniref:Uncharacterized protein n=1 Tax=Dreissena polymorpha TaxID=45954 RepID=A0A9D4S593_DREPO|nr:hypothetical protein DPMN_015074 [Dreissena polymorpha]